MTLFLTLLLKPFVALVVFTLTLLFARWLYRRMPESKLKRALFAPLPGHKARRWE